MFDFIRDVCGRLSRKDPVTRMVGRIANARADKIFGETQVMFRRVAVANTYEACDILESALLMRDLAENENTKQVAAAVAEAAWRRIHHFAVDNRQYNEDIGYDLTRLDRLLDRYSVREAA